MSAEPGDLSTLRLAADAAGIRVPADTLPADRQIILNQARFHYLDWGQHGPPVLFLHGGTLTAHTFDLVCLALRADYHCVSVDLRGHGDSEWSPILDYTPRTGAGDIAALAARLGWDRFLLAGMCTGGLNAIAYAGRNSQHLAGLIIIDVSPDRRPVSAPEIRDFLSRPAAFASPADCQDRAARFNHRLDRHMLRHSLIHNLRQQLDGTWAWRWDPRPIQAARQDRDQHDRHFQRLKALWPDVDNITCPTLVLRGADSEVLPPEGARTLASRLPHGQWAEIPHAGHLAQRDNPSGTANAIEEFLRHISYL